MSQAPGAHTVLIVDDDVAFVWWLGEAFTGVGYQTVPALNCRQATALVGELQTHIDLLLVNPGLPGAERMVGALKRSGTDLGVVLIENCDTKVLPSFQYHATLVRPGGWRPPSRPEWLQKLRSLLEHLKHNAC